ncbi:MAG: stalk domain-containing protein [Bacillota bacterium]
MRKLLTLVIVAAMVVGCFSSLALAAIVGYSTATSKVTVSSTTTTAGKAVTLKVRLRDDSGNNVKLNNGDKVVFFIKTDKDVLSVSPVAFASNCQGTALEAGDGSLGTFAAAEDLWGYAFKVEYAYSGSGQLEINDYLQVQVTSNVATTAAMDVFKGAKVEDSTVTDFVGRIGTVTVEWKSSGVSEVSVATDATSAAADGTALIKVTTSVKAGNLPIEGQAVRFSAKKKVSDQWYDTSDLQFTLTSGLTDEDGEVTTYVKTTAAGTYKVIAKAGSETGESAELNFTSGKTSKIVADEASKVVATQFEADCEPQVKFTFYDSKGNKIDLRNLTGDVIKVELDGPEGVAISPAENTNGYSMDNSSDKDTLLGKSGNDYNNYDPDNKQLIVKLGAGATEIEEGTYTITVSIKGKDIKAVATVKAVEQGDVTSVVIEEADDVVVLPSSENGEITSAATLEVYKVDAVGVKARDDVDNYYWAVSDGSKVYLTKDSANNQVVVNVKQDPSAGEVTVTAVNIDDGSLSASYKFYVTKPPVGMDVSLSKSSVLAGEALDINAQLKDVDGNKAALKDEDVFLRIQVAQKPSDAVVGVSYADSERKFDRNGLAKATVTCDKSGTVVLMVYAEQQNGWTFAKRVEFKVGAKVAYGAKNVVMFIGSTGYVKDGAAAVMDVSPVIVGGRTLVPVRAVAESLGFGADWSPKDGVPVTVSLTRPDIQITITIGSPSITVVKNGVATTVTSEVPAQIMSGRTMLPFRAIAEACGAVVDWGPKDAVPTWVSFTQQ